MEDRIVTYLVTLALPVDDETTSRDIAEALKHIDPDVHVEEM